VISDTNRGWCAWMPAIAQLFPDAKVIACVRELPWVIDSIERLIQRNAFSPFSIVNYSAGRLLLAHSMFLSIFSRC
jgi:sulfotransferase